MLRALLRRILPRRIRVALKQIYYFGFRHRCLVCGSRVRRYLPEGHDFPVLRELDVVGGERWPARTCPICLSGTRARLVYTYLRCESAIFERETRVLHLAPETGICWALSRAARIDYLPGDLNPANYKAAGRIEKMDATSIDFDDESFDVVIANHVLEHIVDDRRAMSEIWRVLKPGGWAMLQVPISRKLLETREDDSAGSAHEREQLFGQSDHVRVYGADYPDRLRSRGFEVDCYSPLDRLGPEKIKAWLLNPRENVFIARKPSLKATELAGLAPKPEDAAAPPIPSARILGLRVDATSYAETVDVVERLAEAGAGGMICHANVHMLMEAFDAPGFRRLLHRADRITPDGVPLVWALRLLGVPADRVYGPALTDEVCRRAEEREIPVGFYGGSPAVLDALRQRISERFPRLEIALAFSPPFRSLSSHEDRQVIEAIEASGARILFVGLGCPKQERWMATHRAALPCVLLGVGAAFDFLAGARPQAPDWMQRLGLEWSFRLAVEPRRLWRRYGVHNPRFLWYFAGQFFRRLRSASARNCR